MSSSNCAPRAWLVGDFVKLGALRFTCAGQEVGVYEQQGVMTTRTTLAGDRSRSGGYSLSPVQDIASAVRCGAPGETSDTNGEDSGFPANDHRATDSVVAERLWDALYRARTGETEQSTADLEDTAFRYYLPMARSLAHSVCGAPIDRVTVEQAAELGLAHRVLAWRQRSSAGFRVSPVRR